MPTDPTPEDLSRDLAADLELCERATPGEWDYSYRSLSPATEPGEPLDIEWMPNGDGYPNEDNDGEFFAASRLGWPAALRRAMAAEGTVRALEQMRRDTDRQMAQLGEMIGQLTRERDAAQAKDAEWKRLGQQALSDSHRRMQEAGIVQRAAEEVPCPDCRGTGNFGWNECGMCGGSAVLYRVRRP